MDDRRDLLIEMILQHEGGYVNDSDDAGGMTYMGISRVNNPDWPGWGIIEEHLPLRRREIINGDEELYNMVLDFYDEKFYSRLRLDEFEDVVIAAHLLCQSVHSGRKTGVRLLQEALVEVLPGQEIVVDGYIGPDTIGFSNSCFEDLELRDILVDCYVEKRREFYQDIVERKPSQQKFLNGWMNRVDNTSDYAYPLRQQGI